jgi:hypothetical protein
MTVMVANGVTIAVGDGASPEAFTALGDVIDIAGPEESVPAIDASNLSSTIRSYEGGLREGGEIVVEQHMDPDHATASTLRTAFTAKTKKNYKITLTDAAPATTYIVQCLIIGDSGPKVSMDQTVKRTWRLKVTSAPTIA